VLTSNDYSSHGMYVYVSVYMIHFFICRLKINQKIPLDIWFILENSTSRTRSYTSHDYTLSLFYSLRRLGGNDEGHSRLFLSVIYV
jgi:hypothetical protein